VERFVNPESMREVHPAKIPSYDQMVVYAAQIAASFRSNFRASLTAALGRQAESALQRASRAALIVWQAYAFLAPGGTPFDDKKRPSSQQGQHFGSRSALGYVAYRARLAGIEPDLDQIVTDPEFNHTDWVRSAKTRAAETIFLEALLKRARQVLPH
jgi:hypothetical protein